MHTNLRYTILKGNTFYLNFRIPSFKIIRYSLNTDSKKHAQLIIAKITPLLFKLKSLGQLMHQNDTQDKINALITRLTLEIKEHADILMNPEGESTEQAKVAHRELLEGMAENVAQRFVCSIDEAYCMIREYTLKGRTHQFLSGKFGLYDIDKYEKELGITKFSRLHSKLRSAINQVSLLGNETYAHINNYNFDDAQKCLVKLQTFSDISNGKTPQKRVVIDNSITKEDEENNNSPLLSKCIEDFIKRGKNEAGKVWSDDTRTNNIACLAILLEAIGDKPILTITCRMWDKVFDHIIKGLPVKNKNPYRKFKDSPKEILRFVYEGLIHDDEDLLSNKSVKNYKILLQSLYSFLRDEEIIEIDLLSGMRSKFLDADSRGAFTNTETRDIYNFCLKQKDTFKKWAVILMIYTGCRNNEIVQLYREDIKKCPDTDIWYIHINKNKGKSVKNKTSVRRVPIHDDLKEIGFFDWIDTKGSDERLFPNKVSKQLTRFYDVLKNNLNLPPIDEEGQKISLYSTRHTFATNLLNEGVGWENTQSLLGHSIKTSTMGKHYFKGFKLPVLKDNVNKFKF